MFLTIWIYRFQIGDVKLIIFSYFENFLEFLLKTHELSAAVNIYIRVMASCDVNLVYIKLAQHNILQNQSFYCDKEMVLNSVSRCSHYFHHFKIKI